VVNLQRWSRESQGEDVSMCLAIPGRIGYQQELEDLKASVIE